MMHGLFSKHRILVCVATLLCTACLATPASPQRGAQAWEKAAGGEQHFEAASVRENRSDRDSSSNFTLDGNGNTYWVMNRDVKTSPAGALFQAANQPLLRYIIFAYRLGGTQELALRGPGLGFTWAGLGMKVPSWVTDTHYDIEARAPGPVTKDQMRLMLQSLLAERFKLAAHWETRQAPVFALRLQKKGTLGPQLHAHPAGDTCASTVYPNAASARTGANTTDAHKATEEASEGTLPIPCGMIARLPPRAAGWHKIGGRNITLSMLAQSLPAQTGMSTFPRPVIDLTGLSGTYDFTLEWTQTQNGAMAVGPNAQGDLPGPPIAKALKQQLGLDLNSTKGPIDLLLIDHIEQPTPN